MTNKKIWFITGASRGMGVEFAKAALAAGHAVVGTSRDPDAVAKAVGESDDLLVVRLDVTRLADAQEAVRAAVDRFGRIDVLVNNAGNFYAGFFEELSPEDIEKQLAANLIGPMNVTRAVLPVMRKQRSGHIITLSSSAGVVGFEFVSAYAASKFGVEGWMESLHPEIAPFGIHTTLVNPGFFRTQLISDKSMAFASMSIPDYEERRKQHQAWWTSQGGKQTGDPAKLAKALVQIASEATPPRRWVPGPTPCNSSSRRRRTFLPRPGPTATYPCPLPTTKCRGCGQTSDEEHHDQSKIRSDDDGAGHPAAEPRAIHQWSCRLDGAFNTYAHLEVAE